MAGRQAPTLTGATRPAQQTGAAQSHGAAAQREPALRLNRSCGPELRSCGRSCGHGAGSVCTQDEAWPAPAGVGASGPRCCQQSPPVLAHAAARSSNSVPARASGPRCCQQSPPALAHAAARSSNSVPALERMLNAQSRDPYGRAAVRRASWAGARPIGRRPGPTCGGGGCRCHGGRVSPAAPAPRLNSSGAVVIISAHKPFLVEKTASISSGCSGIMQSRASVAGQVWSCNHSADWPAFWN